MTNATNPVNAGTSTEAVTDGTTTDGTTTDGTITDGTITDGTVTDGATTGGTTTEGTVTDGTVTDGTTTGGTTDGEKKKYKKPRKTFLMKLDAFRQALSLTLQDDKLRTYVEQYGYTAERINEGSQLIQDVNSKYDTQKNLHESAKNKSIQFTKLRSAAERMYNRHVSIARVAFKDDSESFNTLGLHGKREKRFVEWRKQAELFYQNMMGNPDFIARMGEFTVTPEMLDTGNQQLQAALDVYDLRADLKAEAQNATDLKNRAFTVLETWMKDFFKIVNVALKAEPQLKEKVGILVPYLSNV